jgi:hypothetical protein
MRPLARRSSAVAATTVGLLGLGVAFAAWTSTGEGSGAVNAAQAQALTVNVTNVNGLYPTGSVDVPFTVTNPNPYAVTLNTVSLKSVSVDAAHSTCATSVITGPAKTVSMVAAGNGGTSVSQNFTVSMSNAATDACQGATFTVTLLASGLSS